MKKIGIIGYGRFGRVLSDIFSQNYEILIFDKFVECDVGNRVDMETVLECFLVFIAVPIRSFESAIKEVSKYKLYNTTIIDVCSVKVFPVSIMKKYLPSHVGIIASHPHFGPDSYSPFQELKITMCPIRDSYNRFDELESFFNGLNIRIINIDPDTHDKLAASSQGITHFIGRVLKESGVKSTSINTLGFNELLRVIEQTCNDSWDLFIDLQKYNPYTNQLIDNLVKKIKSLNIEIKKDAD